MRLRRVFSCRMSARIEPGGRRSICRPDRAAVLAALRDLGAYDGVTGRIRFDASGERLDAPISFYQVRLTAGGREMHYLGMTSELLPASAAL